MNYYKSFFSEMKMLNYSQKKVNKLIHANKQLMNTNKLLIQQHKPSPAKNVRQMVKEYEDNIIAPPPEFRDEPVSPEPSEFKDELIFAPKIDEINQALKGYTKSYEIDVVNEKDPLVQLHKTRPAVRQKMKNILGSMKGLKFIETLKVTFEKISDEEVLSRTAYFNSKTRTIINQTEIAEALQFISEEQILNEIAQWISEGSGWIIASIDNHYLNIVQYRPTKGSSYLKLPLELQHQKKGLINLQNKDNECFRWCHIRHLNPMDKDPQRIKKI